MITKVAATQSVREAAARFIKQCELASPAEWNFRPQAKAWSMGDVAEHVSIANRVMLSRLSKALLANPIAERLTDVIDDEIPYLFYRGDEPPDVAMPSGDWTSWRGGETVFNESANRLCQWAEEVTIDLRAYRVVHSVFGLMDGMQWLLFAAAHTERHRAQLIGLRRDAAR